MFMMVSTDHHRLYLYNNYEASWAFSYIMPAMWTWVPSQVLAQESHCTEEAERNKVVLPAAPGGLT